MMSGFRLRETWVVRALNTYPMLFDGGQGTDPNLSTIETYFPQTDSGELGVGQTLTAERHSPSRGGDNDVHIFDVDQIVYERRVLVWNGSSWLEEERSYHTYEVR